MNIAFTGPRHLTEEQEKEVYKNFAYFISNYKSRWHVGDAPGLDNFVRRAAGYYNKNLTVYKVEGYQKWHFVERSKRMVDAIASLEDPWLYAFPNKLCPDGCKPCKNPNGGGSGTWLTIAYAKYRGLQIYLFPQFSTKGIKNWIPSWFEDSKFDQPSLFDNF